MPLKHAAVAVLGLSRTSKRLLALSVDFLLCLLTVWLALCLHFEAWVAVLSVYWPAFAASLLFALPLFVVSGLYRAIFRYAGWRALSIVLRAIAIYGALYAAVFLVMGVDGVPRIIGLTQPILLLLGIGASRALARHWLGGAYHSKLELGALPKVLIYGAGSAGRQLASAMTQSREVSIAGFLDDDSRLQGGSLNGVSIYAPADLLNLVKRLQVSDILLALPSISRKRRLEVLESLRQASVNVRTLPSFVDMVQGRVQFSDLKDLEIDDLLGRLAVPPDPTLLGRNIRNKVVLVTGAGGSIGSELCRQILRVRPSSLLLVESSEFALYAIHQELLKASETKGSRPPQLIPLLASVQDERRMDSIMAAWQPQTVYHAAAYKHVPLVEHNVNEGVKNNVFGTLTTAKTALAHGVEDFVLISTDKAVRPTNVMGASKRLAEMVLQALAVEHTKTRFSMVRFGNVLGSSGSVVPLFRQQIRASGPITLTHAEMTRYFMTIPEAAQLVIQAGAMATGGDVFVLDMGEPVKIFDLARRMVELSGLRVRDLDQPEGDIEIVVTGLRPGEKLYEELLIGNNPLPTQHERIMKAHEDYWPWPKLVKHLDQLSVALDQNTVPAIRNHLRAMVQGYQPESEVVDWMHLEHERLPVTSNKVVPIHAASSFVAPRSRP